MTTHYDIFRHHLWATAPGYGHALWDPDPGNLYPAVEVGDVGYISEGRFHRLFNVLLPDDHPSHGNFGVPEHHEQLTLDIQDHIIVGNQDPHNFYSTGVTLPGPESDRWAAGPKMEGEVSFSCPMDQGAALSLPIKAKKEDTVARTKFGKWLIRHIDRWFAWVRQLELGVDRMEDIILVTGNHRTRSFANVAFPGGQKDAQVSFRAKVDCSGDIVDVNWQFSHERNRGAFLNCGPDGEDLPESQCIFIRGFRVARKFMISKRLKAAAGPNPDPEGSDEEPDSDLELIQVPAVSEYRDPLHILLQFIAEEAPNCDMVLVHDDDLAGLRGVYDGTPIESLEPDAVMLSHLRSAQLKIHEAQFDLGLSSADNFRSVDAETVRMPTLSDQPILSRLFSFLWGSTHPKDLLPYKNGRSADAETVRIATLSNLLEEMSPSSTHLATRDGHSDISTSLLEHGADVDGQNSQELILLYRDVSLRAVRPLAVKSPLSTTSAGVTNLNLSRAKVLHARTSLLRHQLTFSQVWSSHLGSIHPSFLFRSCLRNSSSLVSSNPCTFRPRRRSLDHPHHRSTSLLAPTAASTALKPTMLLITQQVSFTSTFFPSRHLYHQPQPIKHRAIASVVYSPMLFMLLANPRHPRRAMEHSIRSCHDPVSTAACEH